MERGLTSLVLMLGAAAGLVGLTAAQDDSDLFELNIIHYNDFHAHFEETAADGTVCPGDDAGCIGGLARLVTAIKQAQAAEPLSLVLNGGDTFQGTIWYNFLKWNVSEHFMNMIPHDAHVLGNHEFDDGPEGLAPYLQRLNAPMLGANVNTSAEPDLDPYVLNHIVVERQGRRIGIIGVLLKQFSAPLGYVVMEDEVEAVNREAAILTEQGVDIIILLSHCGYDNDMRMALEINPAVDVIVGAHSHTLLYTGTPPSGDTPAGEYPTLVSRPDGHRIPIVQASCYTRYLGTFKLYIDAAGVVQSWTGEPVYLGPTVVPDEEIEQLLQPWRLEVDAVGKEVVGRSLVTLNRSWCRTGECNMGSWACDGFLHKVLERSAESARWINGHVCLVNAGGLRVQINAGDITTESLLMAMPFENYLQVFELKGQYLLEALEFSVGGSQTAGDFYASAMVQIGGMRNVYNASMPAGSRVSATVRCIECDVPRYEPLDPEATYLVVAQNYIGEGGSGFDMLGLHRENVEELGVDYVALQEYMRSQQVVAQDLDGRIQIVW